MQFCTHIREYQRVEPNDFGEALWVVNVEADETELLGRKDTDVSTLSCLCNTEK